MLGEEAGSTPGKGNGGEHRPSSQKSRQRLQAQQTSATRTQHAGRACLETRRQRTGTAMRAESSGEPGKGWKQGGGVSELPSQLQDEGQINRGCLEQGDARRFKLSLQPGRRGSILSGGSADEQEVPVTPLSLPQMASPLA